MVFYCEIGKVSFFLWFVKRLRCQWGSDPFRSLAAWPLCPLSLLPLVFTSEQWERPLPSFLRSWKTVKICGVGFMCCWGDAVLFPTCLVHGEALLSQSEGSTQWKRDKSVPAPSSLVWSTSFGEASLSLHREAGLAFCFMLRQCRAEYLSNDCLIKE